MKLIKTIVVGILLVGLMSVVLEQKFNSPLEVINQEVVKEVTPEWASDEDAVKAAQDVIRRKELEAELNTVQSEIEALRARETALEKELGTYWSDVAHVKRLIREVFWEEPNTAVAVAMAESGFNPRAINAKDKHKTCYGSYGIFQVGCIHGHDTTTLYDVEENIRIARALYDDAKARTGNGWQPWGAYTDGSYKRYLATR